MKPIIIGMIYKSKEYLDFMIHQIKTYSFVDYIIIANNATDEILKKLKIDSINHLVYNDSNPSDYYLNRVYRAWNFGGNNADGDIIIFINSDMAFSHFWLDNLLAELNKNTIPCSRLIESGKIKSGKHAISKNFGHNPTEYKEKEFNNFAKITSEPINCFGGLYMPCAFYKKDFISSGGYLDKGDSYFFKVTMKHKQHITVFSSIVYHIQEGELDARLAS